MPQTPFLTPVPSPRILTKDCASFSAQITISAFDPAKTPIELGVSLPPSLASATLKRQAEFLAGRFAAKSALTNAGCAGNPEVAIQSDRSPLWPPGFVGSITHTKGYVSAAAARRDRVQAIGIDSETPMSPEQARKVMDRIAQPRELQLLQEAGFPLEIAVTLAFSTKESLFKALFTQAGRFLTFQEARIDAVDSTYKTLRLSLPPSLRENTALTCRYEIADRIHTAIEIAVSLKK